MNPADLLRVNVPQVIHETINDEVVIVNLETGGYFGLSPSAKAVWDLIDGRRSVEAIKSALSCVYEGGSAALGDHVERFVGELLANALVVSNAPTPDVPAETPPTDGRTGIAFEPPELHAYTDMQDLLLLDPIHEVDETGWPHAQAAGEAGVE